MKTFNPILVLIFALAGCGDEPKPASLPAAEEVLAQYQTIHIGSEKLTLPTIALLSSTKHSNLILADGTRVSLQDVLSQSSNGTRVSVINIDLHSYRELQDYSLDTYAFVSAAFCEKLRAAWEKKQCAVSLYDGKHAFEPQNFHIVDLEYLTRSNAGLFAIAGPGPDGGAAARALLAKKMEAQTMCVDKQRPLCTAVMPLPGNLVAVWATELEEFEHNKKQIRWLMNQYIGKMTSIPPAP